MGMFLRLLAITLFVLAACGSETSPTAKDAATDTAPDVGIDCSKVGCAAPPPCGETCKAPCGCCPNTTCANDAGAD